LFPGNYVNGMKIDDFAKQDWIIVFVKLKVGRGEFVVM